MRTPLRRRAESDRPPTVPPASGGGGGTAPSGIGAAPPGDDALTAENRTPTAEGRAATPADVDAARMVLVVHRLDLDTGRCAACAADCPCGPALQAGRVLVEAGAWNTVPLAGRLGVRAARERPAPGAGRSARLARLIRLIRPAWVTR